MSTPIFGLLGGSDPSFLDLLLKTVKFLKRKVPNAVVGVIIPPNVSGLKDTVESRLGTVISKPDEILVVEGKKHFQDWNNLQYVLDIGLLAKNYDPVVYIDSDAVVLQDLKPVIEDFKTSNNSFAFFSDVVSEYPNFKKNWGEERPLFIPQTCIMFFKSSKIPNLVNTWEQNWKLWIEPAPFVNKKNPARLYDQSTLSIGQYALGESIFQVVSDFNTEVKVFNRRELKVFRNRTPGAQKARQNFLSAGSTFSDAGKITVTISVQNGKINEGQDVSGAYVSGKVGDTERSTKVKKGTLEPEWNQDLVFPESTYGGVAQVLLTLVNRPVNGEADAAIGTATLSVLAEAAGAPGKRTQHTVPVLNGGEEVGVLEIETEVVVEKKEEEKEKTREREPVQASKAPAPAPAAAPVPAPATAAAKQTKPAPAPSKASAAGEDTSAQVGFYAKVIPPWMTSDPGVRIPQYAVDYAIPYYKETQEEKKGQITDLKIRFWYNEKEEACLDTTVVPAKGYKFKHETWTNQWWKASTREIGLGKVKYTVTKKAADDAEGRIEERRKDKAFAAIEKVVLGVATEYDYDYLTAYNMVVKYRDPNVKKGTCEVYAKAVVDSLAGHPLVDHVETWGGGNHAWNVVVLTDGRNIYTDACWYCSNNIDNEGYVEHEPRRTAPDLTFDKDEFNDLGGGIDERTKKLVRAHFLFDDAAIKTE